MASYDIAELRGRIAVCFTTAELRQLAEELGAGELAADRSPADAAREIVRNFERKGALDTLIAKLREARPLVEWPERPPAPASVSASASASAPASAPAAAPAAAPASAPAPAPRPPGEGDDEAPTHIMSRPQDLLLLTRPDPAAAPSSSPRVVVNVPQAPAVFAAEAAPPSADAAPPSAEAAPPSADAAPSATPPIAAPPAVAPAAAPPPSAKPDEPAIVDPYAAGGAGWPGTVRDGDPPVSRGVDPRILIAVAALMVIAAALAFFAGRVSTPPVATSPSAAPSAGAPAAETKPRRPSGLATRASDAIARSLESVARVCEIPPGAPPDIMRRAYEQCGPAPAPPPPRSPVPVAPPTRPAEPTRTDLGLPPPRPVPAPAPPPDPGPPGNAACLSACDRQHQACKKNQCGSEPTQGSQYQAYQSCMGECLQGASKCRLACL